MMPQAETEREALMEQCRVIERMHAVYTVEAYWREKVLYCLYAEDPLLRGDVEEFFATSLTRLGVGSRPVIEFDVPDESDQAGYVDGDTIHLHPLMLERETLLHELAHWVTGEGHTQSWVEIYVALVRGEFGDEAADRLDELLRIATAPDRMEYTMAQFRGDFGLY